MNIKKIIVTWTTIALFGVWVYIFWKDSKVDRNNYAFNKQNEEIVVPDGIPFFAKNVTKISYSWYTFTIDGDCFLYNNAYRSSTMAYHPNGCK